MQQIRLAAATVVLTLCAPFSAALSQTIIVGNASGNAGQQVTVTVILLTGGTEVAGTQNDIGFQPQARIAAKGNGTPDCAVNGDIDKGSSSFAFRPSGCSGDACTGIRALVLATDNVSAIADGSVLYTCKVNIAANAATGDYALAATGVILSDPAGNAIAGASGQNGKVTVSGGGPAPTATAGPPAPCDAPAIQAPSFDAQPGTTAEFNVTLKTGGHQIAGTQSDIGFQPQARIAAKGNGKPDCAVNGDIDKGATSFAFRPSGCSGNTCTGIRALVLSTDNVSAIPNNSVLYTCKVTVAQEADATYPLDVTGVILSDPAGNAIAGANACDGAVIAGPALPPCGPPGIRAATVNAQPGTSTGFDVTLSSGGTEVAGSQNDIGFQPQARIVAKANGTPDCAVNGGIDKGAASFAFRPSGCSGDACAGIRALVLSTDNVAAIPDNSRLYTCKVTVSPNASGTYPLDVTGVILSDSVGNAIEGANGCDGVVIVGGNAQLRCGTANEGEQVQVACPQGVMTDIQFASYGLPGGACGQFTLGTCHAQNSGDVVRNRCLGKSSCAIGANNVAFGDPCAGVSKRLYVQVRCGVPPTPTPTATPRPPSTPTRTATRVPTPTIPLGSAVLTVADAFTEPGRRHAELGISLRNTASVGSVEFTLTDPVNDVAISATAPTCEAVGRATGFSCQAGKLDEFGTFKVVLAGVGGISPGDGPIATVFIDDKAPPCTIGIDRSLALSEVRIFDEGGRTIPHDTVVGSLVCACRGNPKYENGELSSADATFCLQASVGQQAPTDVQRLLTDVTCDGVIDVLDCSAILDMVAGGDTCPKDCLSVAQGTGATLTIPNVPGRPGEVVTVQVGLDNTTTITGLQLSLSGATGEVTIRDARAIERGRSLQTLTHQPDGTTVTVGMINLGIAGNGGIPPGHGPVVEVDVAVASDATHDSPLSASDVRAVGQAVTLLEVPISVAEARSMLATGIGPTDTMIAVTDPNGLPSAGTILFDAEQITYAGKSGSILTGVGRGANGTQAVAHGRGTQVFLLEAPPTPTVTPVPTVTPTPPPTPTKHGGGGGGGGCTLDPSGHGLGVPVLQMVAAWLLARRTSGARRRVTRRSMTTSTAC